MKYRIEVELNNKPKECLDCIFFRLKSSNFGRTDDLSCIITKVRDSSCDNGGERQMILSKMKEVCPLILIEE